MYEPRNQSPPDVSFDAPIKLALDKVSAERNFHRETFNLEIQTQTQI